MLISGILNPAINHLLSRVRHTNLLVIADRGFPLLPGVETIDISLVDDVPTVLDVLLAVRGNFKIGHAWMAEQFLQDGLTERVGKMQDALRGLAVTHEPHEHFKVRARGALGLIRTGDTLQYANVILESA